MKIFDNYVFMTITEVAWELYGATMYTSFGGYCHAVKKMMEANAISDGCNTDLFKIYKRINLIYGMEVEEAYDYIYDYFEKALFKKFEQPFRLTINTFSKSFA